MLQTCDHWLFPKQNFCKAVDHVNPYRLWSLSENFMCFNEPCTYLWVSCICLVSLGIFWVTSCMFWQGKGLQLLVTINGNLKNKNWEFLWKVFSIYLCFEVIERQDMASWIYLLNIIDVFNGVLHLGLLAVIPYLDKCHVPGFEAQRREEIRL